MPGLVENSSQALAESVQTEAAVMLGPARRNLHRSDIAENGLTGEQASVRVVPDSSQERADEWAQVMTERELIDRLEDVTLRNLEVDVSASDIASLESQDITRSRCSSPADSDSSQGSVAAERSHGSASMTDQTDEGFTAGT
jgi:hypothetical protein